jgi:hypothetical protein
MEGCAEDSFLCFSWLNENYKRKSSEMKKTFQQKQNQKTSKQKKKLRTHREEFEFATVDESFREMEFLVFMRVFQEIFARTFR